MPGFLEGMDRVRKAELLLAIALAIAFAGYLIAIYIGNIDTEVIRERYWKNVVPLFDGEIPIMEYPPLSLVFFVIPRLFASSPFGYNVAYVIFTYLFTILGLELMRRIADHYGADQIKTMVVYSVLMALMLEFIADRYDIFPAIMTIAAFYMFIKKRVSWAFILLALGMMTKLYPALLFPVFIMCYLAQKDRRSALEGTAWFVFVAIATILIVYLIEPMAITNFIDYHLQRPLEVGCVAATVIYPFSMIGLTNVWILPATAPGSFGSDDLMGAVPDAIAPILTPLMILLILLVIGYYGYVRVRTERQDERFFLISATILAVLLIFIVVGKVFSSQYLIWAVPFYALVIVSSQDRTFIKRLQYLTVAAFMLTQVNFAYIYGYLGGGTAIDDLAMISMLVRNLMIVATLIMVGMQMQKVAKDGFHDDGEHRGEQCCC